MTVTRHGGEDRNITKGQVEAIAAELGLPKGIYSAQKKFKKQTYRICSQCRVSEKDSQVAFKSCSRCKPIGRIVLYCTR